MAKIGCELIFVKLCKRLLAALRQAIEGADPMIAEVHQELEGKLAKAEKTIAAGDMYLGTFRSIFLRSSSLTIISRKQDVGP